MASSDCGRRVRPPLFGGKAKPEMGACRVGNPFPSLLIGPTAVSCGPPIASPTVPATANRVAVPTFCSHDARIRLQRRTARSRAPRVQRRVSVKMHTRWNYSGHSKQILLPRISLCNQHSRLSRQAECTNPSVGLSGTSRTSVWHVHSECADGHLIVSRVYV